MTEPKKVILWDDEEHPFLIQDSSVYGAEPGLDLRWMYLKDGVPKPGKGFRMDWKSVPELMRAVTSYITGLDEEALLGVISAVAEQDEEFAKELSHLWWDPGEHRIGPTG